MKQEVPMVCLRYAGRILSKVSSMTRFACVASRNTGLDSLFLARRFASAKRTRRTNDSGVVCWESVVRTLANASLASGRRLKTRKRSLRFEKKRSSWFTRRKIEVPENLVKDCVDFVFRSWQIHPSFYPSCSIECFSDCNATIVKIATRMV